MKINCNIFLWATDTMQSVYLKNGHHKCHSFVYLLLLLLLLLLFLLIFIFSRKIIFTFYFIPVFNIP
jgi:hypothetical protein